MAVAFRAVLVPVPHGGMYVIVPDAIVAKAKLVHAQRVRGTVEGVAYRASIPRYASGFHLGVHKATLAAAEVGEGDTVAITIEADPDPLPTDEVPDDLARAIAKDKTAAARWAEAAPSHRREHVKAILDAKQPETRARRIAKAVELLAATPAKAGGRARAGSGRAAAKAKPPSRRRAR